MKTIYFVRHGETEANAKGLLAGSRVDSPLTDLGRQQARERATELAHMHVDTMVTSPLLRASETARIIADGIGYEGPVEQNELLVERDFGSATNTPRDSAFAALDSGAVSDAETVAEFGDRARRALQWLATLDGDFIIVVGHGAFGRMLGTVASGHDPKDFMSFQNLANAGMYEFTIE
jgi:probable phosphoglycerate mutase